MALGLVCAVVASGARQPPDKGHVDLRTKSVESLNGGEPIQLHTHTHTRKEAMRPSTYLTDLPVGSPVCLCVHRIGRV